jgi:hypothetical protein
MNCPAKLISTCASLLLTTLIALLIATSFYTLLLYPFASSSSSRSRSWTPYSNLCYFDVCPGNCCFTGANNKKDQWANVNYFYIFRPSPFCKMGGTAAKPKTVTVNHSETNGFKEEDRSWSIINIHLSCTINTVLSLCAVIFILCLLALIIHRIVRRYCKKRRAKRGEQLKTGNTDFKCCHSIYPTSLSVKNTTDSAAMTLPSPTATASPSPSTIGASPTTPSHRAPAPPWTNSSMDGYQLHRLLLLPSYRLSSLQSYHPLFLAN